MTPPNSTPENFVSVRVLMMSAISDVQFAITCSPDDVGFSLTQRLDFVKWLCIRHPDTTAEVDAPTEWEKFDVKRTEHA